MIKYLTIILIFASTPIYSSVPFGGLSEADKQKAKERTLEECVNILVEGGYTYETVPFIGVDKEGTIESITSKVTGEYLKFTYTYKKPYKVLLDTTSPAQLKTYSDSMTAALSMHFSTNKASLLRIMVLKHFGDNKDMLELLTQMPGKLIHDPEAQKTPASAAAASAKK